MNLNGKKLIMDNDDEYVVIETVQYNNKYYVYMVNRNNEVDAMYGEAVYGDEFSIESIEPTLFKEHILPLFIEKFKKY